MTSSALVDQLRRCPVEASESILSALGARELETLAWEWSGFWARRDQLPPARAWTYWFLLGGRGAGKTRSAAEWVIARARAGLGSIMLLAGTADDVRETMVEGDSGILANSPPDFMPVWEPSVGVAGRLTWPNGVVARGYSAEKPSRIRGKNTQTMWCDDVTNWGTKSQKTWDMAQYTLRVGDAKCVITASPEDVELIESLIENPRSGMVTTSSTSDDNFANLAANFETVLEQYAGTEQEQAERYGIYQKKNKKSPFHGIDFATAPIRVLEVKREDLVEVAIVIDPSETAKANSDECGLMAMGRDAKGHVYALEDQSECCETEVWGDRAIEMAERWKASCFVAESNHGLEKSVRSVLNGAYLARRLKAGLPGLGSLLEVKGVVALVGKVLRASPVRQLYVTGTLHHLPGLVKLETQQKKWDPEAPKRPRVDDRIDTLVHGATYLAKLNDEAKPPPPRGNVAIRGMF